MGQGRRCRATRGATIKNTWRQNNIGRRLNEAVRIFESRVVELLREKGHDELSLAHINLTRNLDDDGTRLSELARRAAISKQSMSELVVQVEGKGLIERRPDPDDGRAKLVCFTEAGFVWLDAFRDCLKQAEREMRDDLGDAVVGLLVEVLAKYVNAHEERGEPGP